MKRKVIEIGSGRLLTVEKKSDSQDWTFSKLKQHIGKDSFIRIMQNEQGLYFIYADYSIDYCQTDGGELEITNGDNGAKLLTLTTKDYVWVFSFREKK